MRKTFTDRLTGRKQVFHLQTLDFEEDLIFKEEDVVKWYREHSFSPSNFNYDPTGYELNKLA